MWTKGVKTVFGLVVLIFLVNCYDPFKPDFFDPRLPKLSEENTNSWGAFINDQPYVRSSFCASFSGICNIPNFASLSYDEESECIELILPFQLVAEDTLEVDYIQITFKLKTQNLDNFYAMHQFHQKTIELTDSVNYAFVSSLDPDFNPCLEIREGKIFFWKINFDLEPAHFSGTFGFVLDGPDCDKMEVFSGRFNFTASEFHN